MKASAPTSILKRLRLAAVSTAALFLILLPARVRAQADGSLTRGIGRYPGDPVAFFGPTARTAANGQRNLALHRSALASSTVDYNLTAHLVTDGIVADRSGHLTVTTPEGVLPRREAEWAIDGGVYSSNILMGERTWIQYDWSGLSIADIAAVRLDGRVAYDDQRANKGYRIAFETTTDGQTWQTVGELRGDDLPGTPMRYKLHSDPNKQTSNDYLPARVLEQTIKLSLSEASTLRLRLEMDGAAYWDLHEIYFLDAEGKELWMQPSQTFASAWMSDGGGRQWLRVDLGAPATIDHITPHWLEEPARWHAETSDDGRYVTLIMEEPGASGCYALTELEVWGTGGIAFEPHAQAPRSSANRIDLSGGRWQLQRASEVAATGEEIASRSFDANDWIWATVPGTVLTSYVNIGAVPDPNYADWVDQISESFFRSNFWYRDEFEVDAQLLGSGTLRELHFDGINWKANVYLNGHRLGRIEGAFMRGHFDVSSLLVEGTNVLAVEIIANEHFGSPKEKNENTTQFNGGILGADNPTFHATIGWDWITTVRGRNAGIWNEVYLTSTPAVTLSDPFVRTVVHNSKSSSVSVSATPSVFVYNHGDAPYSGTLEGWIGDVRFSQPVSIPAHAEQEVTFDPARFPQLSHHAFQLWWPNGYGDPYRYDAGYRMINGNENGSKRMTNDESRCARNDEYKLPASPEGNPYSSFVTRHSSFENENASLTYKAGLREMTYKHVEDSLLVYINGRRFVPLGGNWGFDEHNLCYRSREYLTAVAYHRDMHCTMIRNWVGMIGDEAFYEACDSLGMMIWQDFWLANPADGPDPYDEDLFLRNARDYVRRIRRYAAIGLYCGRNEGYPPAGLESGLRACVSELTPGHVYIPSSADDCVTGHGPYCAQPARVYFERQSGKIHSERGMPAVMNIESLSRTFTPEALWPQSRQWGQHDYTLQGAQRASEFNDLVEKAFGPSASARQFACRAQLINYDGYRAMYESTSRCRSGLLIWMSHPCWPSMVWQTYDYYFEPTAAYFGTKKACEPLHIQLNALTDSIEVVNAFAGDRRHLTAVASVYDLYGHKVAERRQRLDAPDDTTTPWLHLPSLLPAAPSDVYFLRLQLLQGRTLVAANTYIRGREEGNLRALLSLPKANVTATTSVTSEGDDSRVVTVQLHNTSRTPAPFLRLNLKGADGEQILPATYSDNYFTLLPGERRRVDIRYKTCDARAQQPVVEVEGLE